MTNKLEKLEKTMVKAMAFVSLMFAPVIGICIAHVIINYFNTDRKNAEAACNAAKEAYYKELNKNKNNDK
jgi:phosphate/sulfate permease